MFFMIWWELIILATIGIIVGLIFAFSLSYYFYVNPIVLTGELADAMEKFEFDAIMPASIEPRLFIWQAIVVYFICLIIILFPFLHIRNINPVKAMRE